MHFESKNTSSLLRYMVYALGTGSTSIGVHPFDV